MKPFDCSIATPDHDYYCEVKVIPHDEAFNFWLFQPNQIKSLERLTELGKQAIVCIYCIKDNNYNVFLYSDLKKML